jgi:hypothetical protein
MLDGRHTKNSALPSGGHKIAADEKTIHLQVADGWAKKNGAP